MGAETNRDVVAAMLLLANWSLYTGLLWRFVISASITTIADPALRAGLGMLGFTAALAVSFVPVNLLHHRLGGSGNFVRWAMTVLGDAFGSRSGRD